MLFFIPQLKMHFQVFLFPKIVAKLRVFKLFFWKYFFQSILFTSIESDRNHFCIDVIAQASPSVSETYKHCKLKFIF